MGLSEFEELQRRCVELEELYSEAVKDRDEAIEERNKATVLIALQLQDETEELNARIVDLRNQNSKFQEENEDLKIRLEYAKDDLKKLQQRHIVLQIEQEQCMKEKEEALASVHRVKTSQEKEKDTNKTADKNCEDTMLDKHEDPAYSQVKHDIFTSASEEDLELEPRPPVTLRASKPEDLFDVHEELGKGKFGVVKKVTEKSTQTVFAAKYIRLSSSSSGSSRDDIMREINIMNQLHHKRLVGLIDAFDVSKNIVMVMEFVSGGELFERVADADCLTEKEAAYYMYQLLQGLQYMHKKNIIHLDLKPENIVCVSKDSWDIKLIDFGLAQELTPGITMKALKGTPEFMAPEAVNFDTISFSTDMWSVGVIAYILLSGLSPLLGDDVNETLANVTAAEWDFEDESFDVISEEAKNFISMLLVKNPRKRNTVGESLKHDWMKRSASANAVKIDTKKLKQFLAKRRWQKSVNALVAVRRLSNITSLMGLKGRPSIAPSLATVASAEEEDEEEKETGAEKKVHLETRKEKAIGGHQSKDEHTVSKKEDIPIIDESVEEDEKGNKKETSMQSPVFIKELSDISANEGDTVSLEVVISHDINCGVDWFKNGGDVTEGGRLSLVNHGEGRYALVIRDTEEDDSGEFCCVAANEAGKVTCAGHLTIEVLSKSDNTDEEEEEIDSSIEVPVFAKELSDVTASERDTVTLEVVVSGASPYELEWFKNAVDITECERISLVNHDDGRFSLVIRDCEDDDTGEYCCVAQNEAGRVTCAGWLTVEVESSKSEEEESEESEVEEIVWKEIVEIREGDVQTFYCIEEEVGRGRFGIVKKCVELDTATRFCAKFIKSRPSQKAEFKREIDVMNTLHHPRLIRLYDAFEEPRQIILIMEYARGGDLFARIDGDSLPEFEAVKILTQVLEGLKYMHDNHFMHLDLKPQNVMFKNEGGSKIKLIDFSLSRKFDSQQEVKISFGTAEYVAPEIVNYEPVTLAADMWAIGVISYIMLSGDSPFLGPSEAETFSKITEARWEFTDVFDYVSKEAKNFITRLLLKDPKQRMTVDECLAHEWIKSPGFTGKHQSKSSSEGELASDVNHNIVSPTELKRQESKKFDEQDAPLDIHQLEAKLKELLTKAQSEKKEREELEERLREEEERADALEDELRESETMVKKFEENMSKLGKENTDLMKKARTNSETLKRVAESEGEKRGLEDKLAEQTKSREVLIRKYDSLKEKLESYDILEEKVYLLERDRKESRGTKEKLESKIEGYEREREFLLQKDDKNDLEMTEFETEISKLKKERTEYENKYVTLREEKESLVEELTKRFSALDEQKKILAEEKVHLERDLEAVKTENEEMKVKFQRVAEEWELSKEKANKENGEKDKDEVENLSKLKRQKDEAQKTCEDLASKLSKAYVELERARSQDNNETDAVNLQEQISTLKESLSSLKRDRDHVEEELEEREAEIEELKKKIEQLETDKTALTEERDKQSVDYKAQIDMANEKIVALQRASRGRDEDNRNSEMLQSEVSTLREKLAAAKRTNEELEAKVKSNGEAQHSVLEETVVVKRTSQLQSSQSSLFEENDRGYELKKDERSFQSTSPLTKDQRDVNGAADSRMTSMREETGSESLFSLKKNFKLQKKLSQELETSLKREVQKTQMLEDELDNFELEKRRGMTMYRDLEEECERLRKELDDVECSQSEVRLREKLRSRLKAQEEESNALNRQVDYLKKEVQSLKEERDGGNTLYVNLAEKFKNLMKENKQLEQEKHERDQKEKESREMEDSLQTRILELVSMKDEIEAMRDNLRALVREKEGGVKEFTSLQRDYGKLANDCKVLQKQVNEERNRGDNLAKERASLQKKAEEMQKDLNQIDLIAAADKRAIETYAHENKSLKDEKGNQVKETERLRKESKDLYDDLKELKRKKEGEDGVMQEKESLLREVEKFRNENRALLEEREEFDKATKHLNSLRGENASALEEIEVLRKENEALLREREEFNEMKKHLNSLREENARVLEEKEVLRKQNEVLLKTREEFNEVTKHLNSLREENANVLKEKEVLKKENVALLKEHEEFNETKKHLNSFKEENASALEEKKVLRKQNEVLLKDREEFDAMKKHLNSLREENASALEEKEVLRKENEALLNNRKELSEMKKRLNCLKEENASDLEEKEALRRENEDLLSDLEDLRKRGQEYLDVLKCDKERALKETEKLKKENEILLKFRKTKGDIDNLQLPSSEDNQTLRRKSEELETNLQKQALEAMRLKKESTTLKKKVETLTKEIQRLRDERRPREIHKTSSGKETGYKEIEDRYKATVAQVTTCEEEVGFLRKEVEDLTDDKNELLQTYNVLQKEFDRYKGEFCDLEKCLEIKSNDLQTVTELKTLAESRTKELEERLRSLSVENERIRNDLRHVTEDFDSQKEKLDLTEKELRDFTNENEEIHKSYIDLEEKYSCIRKINRELEEDVEIEMRKLSEVKARNEGLSTENSNLRQEIKKLQREFDEKQGVSERSDYERGELNKRIQHLEKKRAKDKACKSEFEVQLTDEKNRSKNLEERKKKLEDQLKGLKEELETKKQEAISALEEELHDLRPLKERANALETEREQLRDKLDFEIRSRDSKTKEIELKKKENDSLLYELESTRHRLVSNVLNPLEEAQLSWNFRVNAADISAGKSKAWSSMKENIVALIRERERLRTENSSLQQACSRMKEEYPVTKQERDQLELTVESVESRQIVQGIVADQDKTDALEHSRKEDLLAKELEVLHKRSDEDEEKMDLLMKEKQDLIGQLEFMKQMQLTADYERDRLADQRGLFAPMENRLGLSFQSETKFQSVQTMERISIIEHQGGVGQQSYSPIGNRELTQWNGNHSDTDSAEEEQLKVARELVRRNRRIFELEQEIALLLKRGQSSNNGKIATEKYTADIESAKEEILRLETENKNLKELSIHPSIASLQKEIGILEADNNSLRTEKEDLVMQISAKDKKIELLEKRVKELTEIRSCTVNGTENGECIEINETEAQTRKYDEELKKAKHRTAELEVELEHFNNSYNAKRKRELDEMETKWAKRLRKECMELQSELSDKHNREKQLWLKKEVELQNIIRQMKIVMDKRLGQAENERRKLEQQLMTVRSSSFHGSMISLDSNSDDSGESPSITPGATSNDVTPGDCLSDRELRRVAYKLNGEEWSQLGTFLGVGDRDLAQLSALSMGPQEKAFRLLCVWRTRCRLGRAQMISQLAVSLEEVKRKDVAQFVLEQFMSGKPRKKLFGW